MFIVEVGLTRAIVQVIASRVFLRTRTENLR